MVVLQISHLNDILCLQSELHTFKTFGNITKTAKFVKVTNLTYFSNQIKQSNVLKKQS